MLKVGAFWYLSFGFDLDFEPWSPLAPPKAGKLWNFSFLLQYTVSSLLYSLRDR